MTNTKLITRLLTFPSRRLNDASTTWKLFKICQGRTSKSWKLSFVFKDMRQEFDLRQFLYYMVVLLFPNCKQQYQEQRLSIIHLLSVHFDHKNEAASKDKYRFEMIEMNNREKSTRIMWISLLRILLIVTLLCKRSQKIESMTDKQLQLSLHRKFHNRNTDTVSEVKDFPITQLFLIIIPI